MNEKLTKQEILSHPLLGIAFQAPEYAPFLDKILDSANEASLVDKKLILAFLLQKVWENCGISLGYRTVYYDFAWSLLSQNLEIQTEEERKENDPSPMNHWDLVPNYNNDFDDYDIGVLQTFDYFSLGVDIWLELEPPEKGYFAYVLLRFFNEYDENRMKDLAEDFKCELEMED